MDSRLLASPGVAALLMFLAGCAPMQSEFVKSEIPAAIPTAVAERRDISSIVTARGITIPNPMFVITAPEAGLWATSTKPGQRIRKGTIVGRIGGTIVRSEAAGVVVSLPIGDSGQVGAGIPVAEVRAAGFGIQSEFELDVAYRLYGDLRDGRAVIANSVGSVRCSPVVPLTVASSFPDDAHTFLSVLCLLPRNTESVYSGLSATVGFATGTVRNVVAVPVESVSGSAETGVVALVTVDGVEIVSVSLGITDGTWIEVTAGLNIGDTVQGIAPNITEGM